MTAARAAQKQSIEELFQLAYQQGASDLHLAAGARPMLRVNGQLAEQVQYPVLTPEQTQGMILSILSDSEQQEFMQSRELDTSYTLPSGVRFRVNIHWEKEHAGLVARVVSDQVPSMDSLYFPDIVYKMLQHRQGIILVTGPTGCGKSTSLAAMIDHINEERADHIVTLEDPVEFLFAPKKSLIRQRQLHTDFLSFADALKHVVRQDPNVIMVGEMRDLETVAAALTVAETGHLVLATLHTLNAAQTIDRVVDIFPPHQQEQIRLQLSMSLIGVVSQQLLPRVSGGRIAAREILINTHAVANLIRENKIAQLKSVIQTNAKTGMQTLDQDIKRLLELGEITEETAMSYALYPETFAALTAQEGKRRRKS